MATTPQRRFHFTRKFEVMANAKVAVGRYFVSGAARHYYLSACWTGTVAYARQTPSAGCKRSEVVSVTEVQPESKSETVMTGNHRIWLPQSTPLECYKVRRS